ncbi:MAG: L-threonine 3-dehydrogenase [Chloroflexi bacterium]|nr:L-threonine 3-dehydrogenase [Chloroflexota bacterium]MBI2976050.1 L-threonine 3-dehydrogenase [Chloroflexota bacterium]MBI5293323.1 L-threonine 3-dehydrogenase [Chloroflexota bacterium]
MKAVVKPGPQPGLELTQRPIPEVGPGEVLVKVRAASICGTDLHIYNWDAWAQSRIRPPVIVGHEVCGDVVARGAMVTEPQIGDFVSLESHVICNICQYCRTGRGHICENTRLIGVDRDGGFAEYITIAAQNAWKQPADLPVEIAALQENFGNAVHTAFAADVTAKKVLVTGCGPVGVMAIMVAKAAGARVIYASDVSDYRLNMARAAGADLALNPRRDDVVAMVRQATDGEGVDVLLEMSGAVTAIDQGFTLLKPGGEAALLGVSPGPFTFDWNHHIIFKGARVYGITGRRLWETWYQSRGLVRSGAVNLAPLITHRFKLEEYDKAFETMASGQSGKVVLFP